MNIDYTSRDYEAFRQLLIDKLQEKMPEYTDTSETDAGIVIIEALANGLDILSLYLDITANDVILPTTQDRRLAVLLAKCLGYTPYNQTASQYKQVFVLSNELEDDIIIPRGTVVTTEETNDLATQYYETMDDLTIPAGNLGNEKDSEGHYLHTVTIASGTSIDMDILGSSTGSPSQKFELNTSEVLVDYLEVYVDEGMGSFLWTPVDNFLLCNETSKAYTISVDEFDICTIEFGNGVKGKIPAAFENGITAYYRIGGGEASNVPENTITVIDSSIPYVDSTFNLEPFVYGHDKESLDSIKINAPAYNRARDRLVTLSDYEDLLRINFPDFLDIKADNSGDNKRNVQIYYLFRQGRTMTDEFKKEVDSFVESRCMIGTSHTLIEYTPQEVDISAILYVYPQYNAAEIEKSIKTYLSSVTFKFGEFLFGDGFAKSDLESEIKDMFEGIASFRINSPSEDIVFPTNAYNVLTLGSITITSKIL